MDEQILKRKTLVCGEEVDLYSADGERWFSSIESLRKWQTDRAQLMRMPKRPNRSRGARNAPQF